MSQAVLQLLTRLRARFAVPRLSPSQSSGELIDSSKVDSLPYTLPYGITKLIAVTTSSVGFGAYLAKNAAQFLRDNEIFVPKDEDDDD